MSIRIKFNSYQKNTVYDKYNGYCAICGMPVSKTKMTIGHKIPLSQGGTNAIDNLMLACLSCNQAKNNWTMEEFLAKIQKILQYHEGDGKCRIT